MRRSEEIHPRSRRRGNTAKMEVAKKPDLGALLNDVPRGAWVALSNDESRVVVFDADLDAVVERAREAGEDDPVLIRVPDIQMALVL
jgi:hypothetical protein